MRSTNLLLALGLTLVTTSSAAPLLDPTPTKHPLFTVVSRIPASMATGVANGTAGKSANHKHTPDCEHNYHVNHNSTTGHTANSTAEVKEDVREHKSHDANSTGDPSPHRGFNAGSFAPPHAIQAHNHTDYSCTHPSHEQMTDTNAGSDEMGQQDKMNGNSNSPHTHTGYRCADASHRDGTSRAGHGYDKKSVVPEVDVTVCLGADCKESELVRAKLDSAGQLLGIEAKNSTGKIRRRDREFSYEDVARQMSGAQMAGGV